MNALNSDAFVCGGAAPGNGSLVEPLLVGLKVPVTNGVDKKSAAASSKVRNTPVTARLVPVSDKMTATWPWGPTRRTSMSSGKLWERLLSLTVRLVIVTHSPATTILEG